MSVNIAEFPGILPLRCAVCLRDVRRGGRPCPPCKMHSRNAKIFGEIILPKADRVVRPYALLEKRAECCQSLLAAYSSVSSCTASSVPAGKAHTVMQVRYGAGSSPFSIAARKPAKSPQV